MRSLNPAQNNFIKLATVLITLISIQSSALAEETQFSVSGQVRIRAEGDDYTDYLGDRDFFLIRARPVFKIKRGEQFTAVLAPQFARNLGEAAYLTPVNTGTPVKTGQSGNVVDPSLGVHEAYLIYSPTSWLTLKGGRMIYSYGDELVIGALEWNNVGRSFDGFNARVQYGIGWSDFFINKIADNNTVAPGPGDTDFFGLYNSAKISDYLQAADLYVLYQRDASSGRATHLGVTGLRFSSPVNDFDYRAEFTKELGTALVDAKSAYQADVELGYKIDTFLKPRVGAEYFTSGSSYQQLYPTLHKWLGFADVLGRRNVSGFAFHLDTQLADSTKLKLNLHHFTRTDRYAPAYKLNGSTPLGAAGGSSSKTIGNEIDLTLTHKISTDLTLTGGASILIAGKYLRDQLINKNPTFYFTSIEAKF